MPKIGEGETNSIAYWDDVYRNHRYPTIQSDNLQRYRAAAALQRGDSALDVGCGQAALGVILLEQHPDLRYVGLDYSVAALQTHCLPDKDAERWRIWCGDWRVGLTRAVQPFSTVYLNEILEHEPEPEALLKAAAQLATERIVITVPAYNALHWDEHRGEHAWDFTEDELRALLEPWGEVGPVATANSRCIVVYVDRKRGG